ncbi:MAG: homoserine O-acetyltransferase [Gammaproteobacteria bacterium]|nr:MAG: homoserine O-acetyltransferase [Gammaproteobacteria bacterium]
MNNCLPKNSVGVVTPVKWCYEHDFTFKCGKVLSGFELVYETYGQLNNNRSNAILICHALSGDHHVAGYHSENDKKAGWWDNFIGPGKIIDTNRFFVVCSNNLGGCSGSTGPSSINPATNRHYGLDFPLVTVEDWVKGQALLADYLGIDRWAAVIGGSMGGMQSLRWAIDYPDRLSHALVIAATSRLSTQNIAFNEVARRAIMSDPDFANGDYYDKENKPEQGLMLARMLGHITYLSDDAMRDKFGRELSDGRIKFGYDAEFEVENYLRYQGRKFVDFFDANTYLLMTKALDYFDPAVDADGDLSAVLKDVQAKFFVASFTSDWRFNPSRSREIVKALLDNDKDVSYLEVEAEYGHDGFLMKIPQYMSGMSAYMERIAAEVECG